MGDWLRDYYADVDNMDLDPYVNRHTDDAVVTFANNPPAAGKGQIADAIGGFFQSIGGLTHHFTEVHTDGDTTILEADVEYTRLDGSTVTIPSASVLHRRGDLVDALRIYIDLAPLFAPAQAED
jgi:ketosteroid isomerase-like protein